MEPNRVLVVDDEPPQLEILKAILGREGFDVDTAATAETAIAILRDAPPTVILTDLKLPGRDGIDLLEEAARLVPQTCVIIMTAHGTIDTAVEAMKKGAFDYLTKPLVRDTVVLAVRRAMEKTRLLRENLALQQQLVDRFSLANIIGDHGKMQEVFRMVFKVAPSTSTVLIYGESGTGKELIARALHYNSPRAGRPFLAINCAAIPEPLLESELFGHEKGAFTGAIARKIGLFEEASGSTLFLDEVGDLGMAMQAKLLRTLQEKEIRRVGGNASIPVDVRIVAATNRSLTRLMQEGRFREDLFYRLNVLTLLLPPLRERTTDIPRLVDHFIARHGAAGGKVVRGLDGPALAALMSYHWPGNVRQLESAIERAVLLAEGPTISLNDLPLEVRQQGLATGLPIEIPDTGISFEALERGLIQQALAKGGNVSRAARLLGLTRRTLQYRLEKFGLSHPTAPDGAPDAPEREDPVPIRGMTEVDPRKSPVT
ncbi:MAG TPA: sigma-54 dependent transcriptional regulator [Candidatus Polarisedimenticolia bacterium]|nr:sigma-54 dependent transcriptional regulator [Candidatus Polarisedimenticolia bacterium]